LEDCVKDGWSCWKCGVERERQLISEQGIQIARLTKELASARSQIDLLKAENNRLRGEIHSVPTTKSKGKTKGERLQGEERSVRRNEKEAVKAESSSVCGNSVVTRHRSESKESGSGGEIIAKSVASVSEVVNSDDPNVLIMGDSLLRFVGDMCPENFHVDCLPGIRIEQLEKRINNLDDQRDEKVVLLHVGTNDIKHAKTDDHITGFAWDLCTEAANKFASAKIIVSGILRRRNFDSDRIDYINEGIEWVCRKKGLLFVDPNCWIRGEDLGRDGLHLNRRGSKKFAGLLCEVVKSVLSKGN
jgi:hypothetical protein